jgi:hypothetical protein
MLFGGGSARCQLWNWHSPVNAFQPGVYIAYYQWTQNSLFCPRSLIELRYTLDSPFFSSVSFSFIHRKRLRPLTHWPAPDPEHCTIHRIILSATSSHSYLNRPTYSWFINNMGYPNFVDNSEHLLIEALFIYFVDRMNPQYKYHLSSWTLYSTINDK